MEEERSRREEEAALQREREEARRRAEEEERRRKEEEERRLKEEQLRREEEARAARAAQEERERLEAEEAEEARRRREQEQQEADRRRRAAQEALRRREAAMWASLGGQSPGRADRRRREAERLRSMLESISAYRQKLQQNESGISDLDEIIEGKDAPASHRTPACIFPLSATNVVLSQRTIANQANHQRGMYIDSSNSMVAAYAAKDALPTYVTHMRMQIIIGSPRLRTRPTAKPGRPARRGRAGRRSGACSRPCSRRPCLTGAPQIPDLEQFYECYTGMKHEETCFKCALQMLVSSSGAGGQPVPLRARSGLPAPSVSVRRGIGFTSWIIR